MHSYTKVVHQPPWEQLGNPVNGWKEENVTDSFVRHGKVSKAVKFMRKESLRADL